MVMVDNQDNIETEEDKNLTEYEQIWKKMREELNVKASNYVPQMYDALIKDGYTPEEARDKIKKDSINLWKKETIDKFIPEEAKKQILVHAGKKGAEIKAQKRLELQSRVSEPPKQEFTPNSEFEKFRDKGELEPIKPRPDLGEPSKDDWLPPAVDRERIEELEKELKEGKELYIKRIEELKQEIKKKETSTTNELELTMERKDVVKLVNELRIDVLARMSKDGFVKFIMDDKSLTYELL